MIYIPQPGHRIRLIVLGYSLIVFLWLTPEESLIWPAALLGSGISVLSVVVMMMNWLGGRTIPVNYILPGAAVAGMMMGLGASIATASLMFFKNALHAHLFLDFPLPLMIAILQRAPIWALAGGLSGVGLGLTWLGWRRTSSGG